MIVGTQPAGQGQRFGGLHFVEREQAVQPAAAAVGGRFLPLGAEGQRVARVNGQGALVAEQVALPRASKPGDPPVWFWRLISARPTMSRFLNRPSSRGAVNAA